MSWNLESRWVADIDNNVLPRRHFRDYLCYWCLDLRDYKLWPCFAEYFSCPFPFARIVIRLSGSAVCWLLLISAVHPNLTFPCPICPIVMLTWCVSPQSMHGEWLASCNQFLRGSRFFVLQGFRITAAFLSKGSEKGVRTAVETPPLVELIQPNLETSWRARMCTLCIHPFIYSDYTGPRLSLLAFPMPWKHYTMENTRRITKKLTPSLLFVSVAHWFQGVCISSHSAGDMTISFLFFSFCLDSDQRG